jgi:signal transduction histidine kinase
LSMEVTVWDVFWYLLPIAIIAVSSILYCRQRYKYEKQLSGILAADRIKSEHFAYACHELRMAANVVSLSSKLLMEQLRRRGADDGPTLQYADMMTHHCRKLTDMCNTMLDAKRMELTEDMHLQYMDISKAVGRCCKYAKTVFDEKNIRFTYCSEPESVCAYANERALEHVLDNLISNAAKAVAEGQCVDVAVSYAMQDGKKVAKIDVCDTGCGIDQAFLPRIFDKFVTGDVREDAKDHSCGLGLAIVKMMVRAQKGEIFVESKVGEGSRFSVILQA